MNRKRGRPVSEKISLSPERVKEAIKYRGTSLRKMDKDPALDLSGKTISRALRDKEIIPDNLERIGEYLNVSIGILSGAYDKTVRELIQNGELPPSFYDSFRIDKHPYIHPSVRNRSFLNIIQSIFLNSGLPENSYNNLHFPQNVYFICDMENAINDVLHKYFDYSYSRQDYETFFENDRQEVRIKSSQIESTFNS